MKTASGRAMLILLAGLVGCFAALATTTGTAASAKSDDEGKPVELGKYVKHRHHYAHRHSSNRRVQQSSDDRTDKADRTADKGARKDTSNDIARNDVPAFSAIPPSVANANAQVAAADTPAAAASAMTARANDNMQAAAQTQQAQQGQPAADSQAVRSDQLNDADRALHEDSQPAAPKTVVAAADAQPRPAPVIAAATESSIWDQTTLIGKIFIGFGALLTLASAARMFLA